jgi:sulfate transport system ATP-binding protein
MSIEVRNIRKSFGSFEVLRDVSLAVETGTLVALLGPSGSGKTTLLRVIAGLEQCDEGGTILFHDEDVAERHVRERQVGFVFQHYALFRHMTVFENVAFGLRVRPRNVRPSKQDISDKVHELLHLVQLDGFSQRYPNQLSGGQRQRVALARALAVEPKVLLLDEPFGALDAKVRQELRQWLRRLHDELHITSVFVTHDQEEAFEVADRVVIMNRGAIEQEGTPEEIFEQPATPFVMDFLGNVNVFEGSVREGKADLGSLEVDYPEYAEGEAKAATGFARAHELDILKAPNGRPAMPARVIRISPARPMVRVRLFSEDFQITLNVDVSWEKYNELKLKSGQTVYVAPRKMRIFVQDYQI